MDINRKIVEQKDKQMMEEKEGGGVREKERERKRESKRGRNFLKYFCPFFFQLELLK